MSSNLNTARRYLKPETDFVVLSKSPANKNEIALKLIYPLSNKEKRRFLNSK